MGVVCIRLRGNGWGFLDGTVVSEVGSPAAGGVVVTAAVEAAVVEAALVGREDNLRSLLMVTNMQSSNANIRELICARWKLMKWTQQQNLNPSNLDP